jgi:hypothetical protein
MTVRETLHIGLQIGDSARNCQCRALSPICAELPIDLPPARVRYYRIIGIQSSSDTHAIPAAVSSANAKSPTDMLRCTATDRDRCAMK